MKTATFFFPLLLAICSTQRSYSQFQSFLIADSLKKEAHAVVRYDNTIFKIENPSRGILSRKFAITCLDEQGEKHIALQLDYNKLKKIKNLSGALYDAFGKKLRNLKDEEITDHGDFVEGTFYGDVRLKIAQFTHNQYPYTVEFEYEQYYNGLYSCPEWTPQEKSSFSVQTSTFTVITPKDFAIRYQPLLLPIEPQIKHEENADLFIWKIQNIKAFKPERLMPDSKEFLPRLKLASVKFEIEGFKGQMDSWESYGKFIAQLNVGRDEITTQLKAKVIELTKDCNDERCKIEKIYGFLQNTTRYVGVQLGIGGLQTIKASEVEAHKYGDCKALSNYAQAMLKSIGIASFYVLVQVGNSGTPIQKDFIIHQFNHQFLCVPLKNDTMWLECTSQSRPINYLGDWTDDRDVLLITPEGGKIIHTRAYTMSDNIRSTNYRLTLNDTGGAQVESSIIYKGILYDQVSHLAEKSNEDQRKWALEDVDLPSFDIQALDFQFVKSSVPSATEKYLLKLDKYGAKSGKRIFFQPNTLNRLKLSDFGDSARTFPIQVSTYDYSVSDSALIQLPANYVVESMPENKELHSAFGDYKATYEKLPDGSIRFIRSRTCFKTIQPKEKFSELKDYMKKMAMADAAKIALVSRVKAEN